jgi:hypothetical protein
MDNPPAGMLWVAVLEYQLRSTEVPAGAFFIGWKDALYGQLLYPDLRF